MSGAVRLTIALLCSFAAGACSARALPDSTSDALSPAHTPLRPNDAGVVLAIGARCKPEDGWQYVWPPGPESPDGGGPTAIPVPADYKATHQLEPGIGYCL